MNERTIDDLWPLLTAGLWHEMCSDNGLVVFADGVDLGFTERDGGGQKGGGYCDTA